MPINITAPLAANRAAQKTDVQQLKKALNRLGYYTPSEKIGITALPDAAMFAALAKFQADNGLKLTAQLKPNDATLDTLNKALANAPNAYYVWHTVADNKVRASHAALNGTLRQWADQPTPATDYNCRCWAERLSNKAKDRKKAILGKGHADFSLATNNSASDEIPWYFDHAKHEVTKYKQYIIQESKEQKIDKTLIKAIIYLEPTQGWYDGSKYIMAFISVLSIFCSLDS